MYTPEEIGSEMFRSVFDAMPSFAFVVDNDVRIQAYNTAAADLILDKSCMELKHRAGEMLHCLHPKMFPKVVVVGRFASNV